MAIHTALALSLFGSLGLAVVLLAWADRVTGARLLVLFLLGVSAWIVGNELPNWTERNVDRLALLLLATGPLTSAVFYHFTTVFTRAQGLAERGVAVAYSIGAAGALLSMAITPGHFEPFAGITHVAMPNTVGWIASLIWAGLAAAGQLVLVAAWLRLPQGLERRQVEAISASSAWGLLCMSGYAIAALRLDAYPWPLVGLPLYPLILVYGVLRYRVLVANAWARRALAWALLVAIATFAVGTMPGMLRWIGIGDAALPWLSGIVAAGAFVVLGGPLRLIAERLIYPGGTVSAEDLASWRLTLARTDDGAALTQVASELLTMRLRMPVGVHIGDDTVGPHDAPRLVCQPANDEPGRWRTTFEGWDAAPPGPRRAAALFGAVLAEEAARLARAASLAARERARVEQARLAELGQLAATVAHDIRNPLNIIGMAAAGAPAELRAEIREQVARITRLAQDLLDYARPWHAEPEPIDLSDTVRALSRHHAEIEIGAGLAAPFPLRADPRRLQQAVGNLLDNARAAGGGRITVDAERRDDGAVLLRVCDNGAGIPEDMRATLFTPFASRSPGGTGLGLSIVAKIAELHGGSVSLEERPGWTTCFTLTLPAR